MGQSERVREAGQLNPVWHKWAGNNEAHLSITIAKSVMVQE